MTDPRMAGPEVSGRKFIGIGLDAADHRRIDHWISAGKLPALRALRERSAHGRLIGETGYTAETGWTVFWTGCWSGTTDYWSPAHYNPDYTIENRGAFAYNSCSPFFEYADHRSIIAFDLPQTHVTVKSKGPRVIAWGAHSPQTGSYSAPPELLADINSKHGAHPALHHDDFLVWQSDADMRALTEKLIAGVRQRTKASLDLMANNDWDVFLTTYGETHSAGHGFWHFSDPEHPLYPFYAVDGDPMLEVYEAVDESVAELVAAAPADATIAIFAQEGMKSNCADMPSWLFLPELLYRYSFNGEAALALGDAESPPPPLKRQKEQEWMRAVWSLREGYGLLPALDRVLPLGVTHRLRSFLKDRDGRLIHPLDAGKFQYMPPMWYQKAWPKMKAFALPTFSDGYVRVNVKGREKSGIVDPASFASTLDEIEGLIRDLRDPRSGKPVAKEIIRTRQNAEDDASVYADIIVMWDPQPTDVVDSTAYGRIGPAPFRRSGDHYSEGFYFLAGPDVRPGKLKDARLVDFAPTVCELLGAPLQNHFDGSSFARELMSMADA